METPTYKTEYGDIPLDRLIHVYNVYRASELRKQAKRYEFFQTDEGKALNRSRSKSYYERNKEKVKEKNKARYHAKKEDSENTVPLE